MISYTELCAIVYASAETREDCLQTFPIEFLQAWRVLRALNDRKGFDWWFDELNEELQDEIFAEIVKAINPDATTPA